MVRIYNRGITIITVIITIIILLILSGMLMLYFGGENELISKGKLSKEKYSISEAKEKLELNIMNLRVEQESKGELLTKEDLPKINNNEIDVKSTESFPVEIICGKYKFKVDEDFVVVYIDDEPGTIVTYTTELDGYTNKDDVKILIVINNERGIKTVEFPDGDKFSCDGKVNVGIDYNVNKNGIYKFKIIDQDNKEVIKDVVIDKIDKFQPKDFVPTIIEAKSSSLMIKANAEDEDANDESSKSGIARYEYYIRKIGDVEYIKCEAKEEQYKIINLEPATEYNIYVIAYDYAGNGKNSSEITVSTIDDRLEYPILRVNGFVNCMDEEGNYYLDENVDCKASDALKTVSFDNDFNTYGQVTNVASALRFKIDEDCWGNYIAVYCSTITNSSPNYYGLLNFGTSYDQFKDVLSGLLGNLSGIKTDNLITKCVMIPNESKWGRMLSGTEVTSTKFNIYEIWCSNENLSGNKYTNDNKP